MDRSNKDRKKRKSKGKSPISAEQAEKIAALRRGEGVYLTIENVRYFCHKDPKRIPGGPCLDLVLAPYKTRHYLAVTSPYQSKSNDHTNLLNGDAIPSYLYHKLIYLATAWTDLAQVSAVLEQE